METIILVSLALVVVDALALRFGADSREGLTREPHALGLPR